MIVLRVMNVALHLSAAEFLKHFNTDGTAAHNKTTRVITKVRYTHLAVFVMCHRFNNSASTC